MFRFKLTPKIVAITTAVVTATLATLFGIGSTSFGDVSPTSYPSVKVVLNDGGKPLGTEWIKQYRQDGVEYDQLMAGVDPDYAIGLPAISYTGRPTTTSFCAAATAIASYARVTEEEFSNIAGCHRLNDPLQHGNTTQCYMGADTVYQLLNNQLHYVRKPSDIVTSEEIAALEADNNRLLSVTNAEIACGYDPNKPVNTTQSISLINR